jgi:hypothetical protein
MSSMLAKKAFNASAALSDLTVIINLSIFK